MLNKIPTSPCSLKAKTWWLSNWLSDWFSETEWVNEWVCMSDHKNRRKKASETYDREICFQLNNLQCTGIRILPGFVPCDQMFWNVTTGQCQSP